MSNTKSIPAVTATIRTLLDTALKAELPGTAVTTKPPDKARDNVTGNQVNVFLYAQNINAAFRNADMPGRVNAGETGFSPLPLVLYYLITAYGNEDDEILANWMLNQAMGVLHSHPVLGADELRAALPGNDLADQVERVRITYQPMSLEEVSKLWTAFQTQFRFSVAYQVSVVLIESRFPARTAPPVLARGHSDSGVGAQSGLAPDYPGLTELVIPGKRPAARPGDKLVVQGFNLADPHIRASVTNEDLGITRDIPLAAADVSAELLNVRLPAPLPAGRWMLDVKFAGKPDRPVGSLPFLVAPGIKPGSAAATRGNKRLTVKLLCDPPIEPKQIVSLLLGQTQIALGPVVNATDSLTFTTPDDPQLFPSGARLLLRLHVNGADSLPLVSYDPQPPTKLTFDDGQKVTLP